MERSNGTPTGTFPSRIKLYVTLSPLLDLHLSISNGFVSSKIYDKRDEFDFDIVNVPVPIYCSK